MTTNAEQSKTTTTNAHASAAAAAAACCCRICYEDGSSEELIEPCECSGTLGLIHASCLERWLSTWNTDRCEICKYGFAVERRNKPFTQSFWQWWRTRGLYGPQGVTGDAVCLTVLTPLCFAATYLCGIGATAYARLGFWEGTGLGVLCCMLVATYFLWFFVTIRFHYKSWKTWCVRNQDVRLLAKWKISENEREKFQAKIADSPQSVNDNITADNNSTSSRNTSWFSRILRWFHFRQGNEPLYNLQQQTTFV